MEFWVIYPPLSLLTQYTGSILFFSPRERISSPSRPTSICHQLHLPPSSPAPSLRVERGDLAASPRAASRCSLPPFALGPAPLSSRSRLPPLPPFFLRGDMFTLPVTSCFIPCSSLRWCPHTSSLAPPSSSSFLHSFLPSSDEMCWRHPRLAGAAARVWPRQATSGRFAISAL
jgi:hypothetical protein